MIARYKGVDDTVGYVHLKPGSEHTVKVRRKLLSKQGLIWLVIDGSVEVPYTLEGLYAIWEPVKE